MDVVQIVLRIVHIFAGVAWVGGAALFFFYLEPTVNKLGADAEKFVEEVLVRRKLPIYFVVTSSLAVLFGAFLYWRDTNGLDASLVLSPTGLAFGLGGLAGLVAWAGGNVLIPRTFIQIQSVGRELRESAQPPDPAVPAKLHQLQERLRLIGAVDIVLLAIALLGMASARYV